MILILFICIFVILSIFLLFKKNYENFTVNVTLTTLINEIKTFMFSENNCKTIDDIKILINSENFKKFINDNFSYFKENNKFSLKKIRIFLENNNLNNLNKFVNNIFKNESYLSTDRIHTLIISFCNNYMDIINIIKTEFCKEDIELIIKSL